MADQPLPRALFPNRSSILHQPGAMSKRCWVRGRMRGGKGGVEFCVRRKVRGVRGGPLWMCSTPPVAACPVWALPQVKK